MTPTAQTDDLRSDWRETPFAKDRRPPVVYRFQEFSLNTETGDLVRRGKTIPIEPLPRKFLTLLLDRAQHLVTRAEAETALWPKHHEGDHCQSLNCLVRKVRRCLSENGAGPALVRTIPRHGWIFTKSVEAVALDRGMRQTSIAPEGTAATGVSGSRVAVIMLVVPPGLDADPALADFAASIKSALEALGLRGVRGTEPQVLTRSRSE